MAKRVSKSSKTTDETLSAVEEALKIDFGQEASADAADDPYGDFAAFETNDPAPTRTVLSPSSPAANDERGSGSARFAAALARKPSNAIIWTAVLLSLIWIGLASWAGYSVLGDGLFTATVA